MTADVLAWMFVFYVIALIAALIMRAIRIIRRENQPHDQP